MRGPHPRGSRLAVAAGDAAGDVAVAEAAAEAAAEAVAKAMAAKAAVGAQTTEDQRRKPPTTMSHLEGGGEAGDAT